ncbi:MAG: hypothetical protein M1814_005841 [Vezdaea aestivalis]|nr:MAG: hypothetical protein M1814_005841 [Vezdaea aestivalis]
MSDSPTEKAIPTSASSASAPGDKTTDAPKSDTKQQQPNKEQKDSKDGKEKKDDKKSKDPAGGYDQTPVPTQPAGYTVRFTFHRAISLPMADINTLSSDPYLLVQLNTGLPSRHKEDPLLRFRTKTIQRCTDPVWDTTWVVAHVPASGFKMKVRIYDEDPFDHDDRLGNVHVTVPLLSKSFQPITEQSYKVKKRMGSKRAYFIRACAAIFNHNLELSGHVVISIEVLGRSEGPGGRVYTIGPQYWIEHFSPLLGRIAGTKEGQASKKKVQRYNFQANELQLRGPVPPELYHRYVEFKPFIKGMFSKSGIRGRILNRAGHHQHARIYQFDASTVYGCIAEPGRELARRFLEMVHFDEGSRIWTYIVTLDGLMRFTETGKEFGIDMLSKHTMHSDMDNYIAYSGEFFVRRRKGYGHRGSTSNLSAKTSTSKASSHKGNQSSHQEQQQRKAARHGHSGSLEVEEQAESSSDDEPPHDPEAYILHIDNDSGTYRPTDTLLPQLKQWLEMNFQGLKIKTGTAMDDRLQEIKKEQRERKKAKGTGMMFVQGNISSDSVSSSDIEDLDHLTSSGSRKSANGLAAKKAAIKNLVHGGASGADGDGSSSEVKGKGFNNIHTLTR